MVLIYKHGDFPVLFENTLNTDYVNSVTKTGLYKAIHTLVISSQNANWEIKNVLKVCKTLKYFRQTRK